MRPLYLDSFENGRLRAAAEKAKAMLGNCSICPRKCRVNRLDSKAGFCRAGAKARVYSYFAHHGEEPPISGTKGSGTVFFSGCSLSCVYCQNHVFSQNPRGKEMEPDELAGIMLRLQKEGCHNINLVTPTHVMPQILESLEIAAGRGLGIPLVYNTSGYELPEMISLLSGVIDIYLADMRYSDAEVAAQLSGARNYPEYNRESVKLMHSQVGLPQFNGEGIIERGLIIRHLVLPEGKAGTRQVMQFIAKELSPDSYVSLMSQYTPYHRAGEFPAISRPLNLQEYEEAKAEMAEAGLSNGWTQDSGGLERLAGVYLKPSFNDGE